MMTLEQIAELIDGTVVGDKNTKITGIETIEGARSGDLTFAVDQKLTDKLKQTQASAALISRQIEGCPIPHVRCDDVTEAFTRIANEFRPARAESYRGISPQAFVSPTAQIDDDVTIFPNAYVGDHVVIKSGTTIHPGVCLMQHSLVGRDVTIFPNAVLYENSVVGDRSIVHANAVIGAYGFGYDSGKDGHEISVQLGNVELGDDVDVGACSTIDRGTFGSTRIGNGTKMDNQVMIGHNCQIGSHNLLCSQVGIAGSCQTGSFVVMAGQVGIGDHLSIGDEAILFAKSGVMHDLDGGRSYMGAPATVAREKFKMFAVQSKLPEMRKQLVRLQKQVKQIEANQSSDSTNKESTRKAA